MHKEGLEYFKKVLAGNLKPQWEKIVKGVCDSPIHINLNDKIVKSPAGWSLKFLPLCYKCAMLWTCTNYAAECYKCYMSTAVKIPHSQGIARLEELNNMSSYEVILDSGANGDLVFVGSHITFSRV